VPLEVTVLEAPRTLGLGGELDLHEADDLSARLALEGQGWGDLTLDTSQLTFIDSSGLRALLRVAESLAGRGNLVLRSPSPPVRRVLELMGLGTQTSGLVVQEDGDGEQPNADSRTYDADRAVLAEVRGFIRHRAVRDSFGHWADSLVLAASEACANAIRHSGSGSIQVTWSTRGDRAEVEVRDDGMFRRATSDREGSHGRGILLMMSVMDQITISCGTDARPGTVVRMVKFKNGRAARRETGSVERAADQLPTTSRQVAS
jgi:anti-sigma B factor antagonist